ncbi:MAG: GNAT family N-acetyltransferase [Cyclobacteriaceae bacterium]
MKILSVRDTPEIAATAIKYFQKVWDSVWPIIYEDCITHAIESKNPLPQWYLMEKDDEIIGCAGLVTNDFISRMDLYPWVCAVFIDEKHRGNAYGSLLLEKAKSDALAAGFENLYLSMEHIGYYEKYGFNYVGQGYHPWGEESRIYALGLK